MAKEFIEPTREWLEEQYKTKTAKEIAKELGVSQSMVCKRIRNFHIKKEVKPAGKPLTIVAGTELAKADKLAKGILARQDFYAKKSSLSESDFRNVMAREVYDPKKKSIDWSWKR